MHQIAKKLLALILAISPYVLLSGLGFLFLAASHPSHPKPVWLAVANTSQIPTDGRPVFLPLSVPRDDAWNRIPDDRVTGHVYLRRDIFTHEVMVFSALHGPLSVPIDYDHEGNCFVSRCFGTRFQLDGKVIQDRNTDSPHQHGMQAADFVIVDNVVFVRNTQQ